MGCAHIQEYHTNGAGQGFVITFRWRFSLVVGILHGDASFSAVPSHVTEMSFSRGLAGREREPHVPYGMTLYQSSGELGQSYQGWIKFSIAPH